MRQLGDVRITNRTNLWMIQRGDVCREACQLLRISKQSIKKNAGVFREATMTYHDMTLLKSIIYSHIRLEETSDIPLGWTCDGPVGVVFHFISHSSQLLIRLLFSFCVSITTYAFSNTSMVTLKFALNVRDSELPSCGWTFSGLGTW